MNSTNQEEKNYCVICDNKLSDPIVLDCCHVFCLGKFSKLIKIKSKRVSNLILFLSNALIQFIYSKQKPNKIKIF